MKFRSHIDTTPQRLNSDSQIQSSGPASHDIADDAPAIQLVEPVPDTAYVVAGSDLPPDGGYGWVCTAAFFMINAHTWGVNSVSSEFGLVHLCRADM